MHGSGRENCGGDWGVQCTCPCGNHDRISVGSGEDLSHTPCCTTIKPYARKAAAALMKNETDSKTQRLSQARKACHMLLPVTWTSEQNVEFPLKFSTHKANTVS